MYVHNPIYFTLQGKCVLQMSIKRRKYILKRKKMH